MKQIQGVKNTSKGDIEILTPKISSKHNDSLWYDGEIAKAKTKDGTDLLLIACGEIRIHSKLGNLVYDRKERNEGIKGGLNNDSDLKKIGNSYDADYYWENNNWFEVLFKKKGESGYDSIMGDVAYGYDEAIELFKHYLANTEWED